MRSMPRAESHVACRPRGTTFARLEKREVAGAAALHVDSEHVGEGGGGNVELPVDLRIQHSALVRAAEQITAAVALSTTMRLSVTDEGVGADGVGNGSAATSLPPVDVISTTPSLVMAAVAATNMIDGTTKGGIAGFVLF